MTEQLFSLLADFPQGALAISLLLSITVAVLGLVPSVFITAANILFFGFWKGTAISFAGEALGAAVSFWLYRKGFKAAIQQKLCTYPRLQKLVNTDGKEAFLMIVSLRLLPFVPSGVVTFAAAAGKVSAALFIVASTIGKAPALLLEAYSVNAVTEWGTEGKIVLTVLAVAGIYLFLVKGEK
ncbi:TVP38/TMEM64 family protein [Fictibacillus aquaticus]|uniref:TVP38/TMEM64 family membrane protein n=1 Tax=Fictibacillus aquaticus TaxID=2021314 RepID=A0A235FE77_9BACL|nr:VTT domain-containing protein [Fictibacillus aquaticus]OYD59621.1 hypothetical protein CGZ90_06970 [Fictibacillus aquaticus]